MLDKKKLDQRKNWIEYPLVRNFLFDRVEHFQKE